MMFLLVQLGLLEIGLMKMVFLLLTGPILTRFELSKTGLSLRSISACYIQTMNLLMRLETN